jgi:predicted transcriptional regulator
VLRRTQIYLDRDTIRLLTQLARKSGKTRSELIREAINEVYARNDVKAVVNKIAGLRSFAEFELDKLVTTYRKERKW